MIINKASSIQRCIKRAREELELAEKLVRMTGFRNTAVHEYQQVNIGMVISIINRDTGGKEREQVRYRLSNCPLYFAGRLADFIKVPRNER